MPVIALLYIRRDESLIKKSITPVDIKFTKKIKMLESLFFFFKKKTFLH